MAAINFETLKKNFKGEIDERAETLALYSHDASLFEIRPQIVMYPLNTEDIKTVVKFVAENKANDPTLAITARSAGTDMSGGSIGSSIILDFTRHMHAIKEVNENFAVVEPGCFYRDLEKETLKLSRIMPAYTASKEICAVGGMVANDSGGEKTIKYGKVENYVQKLKVVFTDGNEYEIKKLTKSELDAKMALPGFEGELYSKLYKLITDNQKEITAAKPDVSKNSAGYYLWNVWDEATQTFDLCRLITGSQGTLGIVSEITFGLVPVEKYSNVLAIFMPDIKNLSKIVNEILPYTPDSLESYDDYSMKLAVKFFFDFFKQLGFLGAIKLGLKFIPEAIMMVTGGVPKLILLVEFSGKTEEEVSNKLHEVQEKIRHFGYKMRIASDSKEAEKYWRIRRESFNMLRKHVRGKRTAPFIDDVVVKPEHLPEFLPRLQKLIDEYKLVYTIAGHAGNGNFHIIPLMDLKSPFSADAILELSRKVYDLVHEFHGSITAEHNDGIIRTPYLNQMFGDEICSIFKKTKEIFDPQYILNPGKKVGGTFDDIRHYIKKDN
ncbi:MAG TPA: FAD-binding oxidoreductase [Candidatus Paceibacterota bacterium]|nr:FAD-binding oxidoreductase [Candidatus Paceibacterota bacterium]